MPHTPNFLLDIRVESSFEIPQNIFVTFENNNAIGETNDSKLFNEMELTECLCEISSMSYPEDRMNINYVTKFITVHINSFKSFQ